MRTILATVVVLLLVAAVVLGVRWWDPSTESARDWVIIVYGVFGILFFVLGIGILVAILGLIWTQFRSVKRSVTNLIDESVRPTLTEVQRTAENVRGTSEFIADTAVNPVIRIVSITRGIRRGISSITGIRARRK